AHSSFVTPACHRSSGIARGDRQRHSWRPLGATRADVRQTPNRSTRNAASDDWRLTWAATMGIRSFVEARGASGRVRANFPGVVSQLVAGMHVGWLTFTCAGERRRLAPIPHDWLTAPASVLEEYCAAAKRMPVHRLWRDLGIG